jgi:hypothetical protein
MATLFDQSRVKNTYDLTWVSKNLLISVFAIYLLVLSILIFFARYLKYTLPIAVIALAIISIAINPIQQNTGSLANSKLAKTINNSEQKENGVWASNDIKLDAILLANVKTTLSGQQFNGPNLVAWELIDPERNYFENWNRGASFVTFNWIEGDNFTVDNPANDVISISISPCNSKLALLNLKWVLSNVELTESCLVNKNQFTALDGRKTFIYLVD